MHASVLDVKLNLKAKSSKRIHPEVLACMAIVSLHVPLGMVAAYSAILIPQLERKDSDIPVTKEQTTWLASLIVPVVIVGSIISGWIMETIGRLNTLRLATVPYTIGWIIIATANSVTQLYIGRFLTGLTAALIPSPGNVYITEVARPDLRAMFLSLAASVRSFGMLLVYIMGWLMPWRLVAWSGIVIIYVPMVLTFLWSPESPTWFLIKGRRDDALKSCRFLCRVDTNQDASAEERTTLLENDIRSKQKSGPQDPVIKRFVKGFGNPTGYRPLFILFFLFFFQQFAGIYIIIYYSVTFFEEVNSGFDPYILTILVGTIRVLVGLLTSALLKRFGRRSLCIVSGLGLAITMGISGLYTYWIHIGQLQSSPVPVVCFVLNVSVSVIGLMTIPWTMIAEMFPVEMRGMAQGFVFSLANFLMFIALSIYRKLPDLLGGSHGVQWLFGSSSLVSVVFVYVFLPETHNKTLVEINDYFRENFIYLGSDKKRRRSAATAGEMSNRGNMD